MTTFEENLRHFIKVFLNVGQLKNLHSLILSFEDLLNFLSESSLLGSSAPFLSLKPFV